MFTWKVYHKVLLIIFLEQFVENVHSKAERGHIFADPNTTKILVTGGGSVNKAILQIIADVFNAPVYTQVRPLLWVLSISTNILAFFKDNRWILPKVSRILLIFDITIISPQDH